MARFTTGIGELDGRDLKKVSSYLYKLNRDLEYMFSHLTPEENYSTPAYNKWISDGEKAVQLRVDVDEISATMVTKDGVVAAINLSEEGVKIQGAKISLNGAVSVNSSTGVTTVSIDNETGAITANSGLFKGAIEIARGNNIGLYCNGQVFRFGDFEVNDLYGRQVLQSSDEMTGMSGQPYTSGGLYLWAGYVNANDYMLAVNDSGVYVQGMDNDGAWHTYNVAAQIAALWDAVRDME